MKTRNIIAAAAMGCFSLAQAQEGTSAPAKDAARVPMEQDGVAPKSAYHDCLLNAGRETFEVLRLNEEQVARVTELQNRYKADMVAAEEAKTPKDKKSKKAEAIKAPVAKAPEQPVATAPPAETAAPIDKTGTAVEEPMEEIRMAEQTDPMNTDTQILHEDELAPEAMLQAPALGTPADPAAGDELQIILTPLQWTLWHKQCFSDLGPTGMIQP